MKGGLIALVMVIVIAILGFAVNHARLKAKAIRRKS